VTEGMDTGLYDAGEAEGLGTFVKAEGKGRRALLFARSGVEMICLWK